MGIFAALLLSAAINASGHWEGVIRADGMEVKIEVDLAENAGTFSNPARGIRAFPLSNVSVDGSAVTFAINANGGGTFRGSVDGKSIKGTFSTRGPDAQPLELPFELTRTGDAKIEAAPKNAAIAKELEGRWKGAIEVEGTSRQIELKLQNHSDGSASGFFVTSEGVEIAITTIEQKESTVTLDVKNIGGVYKGTMNADATEIAGTWTQGPFTAPLKLRRITAVGHSTP